MTDEFTRLFRALDFSKKVEIYSNKPMSKINIMAHAALEHHLRTVEGRSVVHCILAEMGEDEQCLLGVDIGVGAVMWASDGHGIRDLLRSAIDNLFFRGDIGRTNEKEALFIYIGEKLYKRLNERYGLREHHFRAAEAIREAEERHPNLDVYYMVETNNEAKTYASEVRGTVGEMPPKYLLNCNSLLASETATTSYALAITNKVKDVTGFEVDENGDFYGLPLSKLLRAAGYKEYFAAYDKDMWFAERGLELNDGKSAHANELLLRAVSNYDHIDIGADTAVDFNPYAATVREILEAGLTNPGLLKIANTPFDDQAIRRLAKYEGEEVIIKMAIKAIDSNVFVSLVDTNIPKLKRDFTMMFRVGPPFIFHTITFNHVE